MRSAKTMVIITYGHDTSIDQIVVSSFDSSDGYTSTDAKTYCDTINRLGLQGNSWVFAKIVSSNTPYAPDSFLPLNFDVILRLDDTSIQKMFEEVDSIDLSKSLRGAAEPIKEKIFRNMSARAAGMVKQDMEVMGPMGLREVKAAQEKILKVIRCLEESNEIIIPPKEINSHEPR